MMKQKFTLLGSCQKPSCLWRLRFAAMTLILMAVVKACPAQDSEPVEAKLPQRIQLPVRAWFEPSFPDEKPELYPNMTMVTSLTDPVQAEHLTGRGVTALRWCYGPNSPWSEGKAGYYTQQAAPFIRAGEFRFA